MRDDLESTRRQEEEVKKQSWRTLSLYKPAAGIGEHVIPTIDGGEDKRLHRVSTRDGFKNLTWADLDRLRAQYVKDDAAEKKAKAKEKAWQEGQDTIAWALSYGPNFFLVVAMGVFGFTYAMATFVF